MAGNFLCLAQQDGPKAAAPPQQASDRAQNEAPSYTFKAVTSMVVVDVVARDKEDNPVRDLTANDLQISEKIGEAPPIPEKIALFQPVTEVAAQRSARASGIVLGWLHKSFCPLTGAYELSYYLSADSRKDGLHRISITSRRPGVRLFFRPGYKIQAEKPAAVEAAELADEHAHADLLKQQQQEAERKKHPELDLAVMACYDTLNITNFKVDIRKVGSQSVRSAGERSKPIVDTYEFLVPGSYFASLPDSERNHPTQLDFSFCTFESSGRPLHHAEGTTQTRAGAAEDQSLATQGFTHSIAVERSSCRFENGRLDCDSPIVPDSSQRWPRFDRSARLVVRDRNTKALGTADILLEALTPDQYKSPIPEGQTNESFGTPEPTTPLAMCGDVYQLTPWTTNLPLFSELDASAPIYATSLGVRSRFFTAGIPGITSRTEWFGVNYQGMFGVDAPGKYEFDLLSDDGAKVYIDDKLIVSDDTIHPSQRSRGKVQLSGGSHTIRVSYFQGPRIEVALVLLVKPPGRGWRLFDTRDFPSPELPGLKREKLPGPER